MIFQCKVEQRLGLRLFSGGASSSNSSGSTTPQLTPAQYLQMYSTAIPSVLNQIGGTAGSTATGLATAASQANPIYTQSGLNQLNQYGSGYQ